MRFNTLRKSINNYFNKNKSKYFLMLLVLLVGVTVGMLFACSLDEEKSVEITQKLVACLKNIDDSSRIKILFSFVYKNIKCISAVLLTAFCVYFMPLIFVNIVIWGFSIGFTSGFITLRFGMPGFLLTVIIIMTQLLFTIPAAMFLSVTALDYTLHNIKSNRNLRRVNRKKLLVLTVWIFAFSLLVSLVDIFFVPYMIKAVSVLI